MVWEDLTNLKHEKKGPALFLSLPEEAKDQIRELVSHEKLKETTTTGTGPTAVTSSKGFKTVLEELDKLYAKDEVVSLYEKFEKYKSCKRKKGQTVSEFLKEFDLVCMQMDINDEMKIPDAFKAIELLHKSNLPEDKEELIKATVSPITYDAMKRKLKEVFCDMTKSTTEIKEEYVEPMFTGYTQRGNNYYSRGRDRGRGQNSGTRYETYSYKRSEEPPAAGPVKDVMNDQGKLNPPSKCARCGSVYHWARQCDKDDEYRGRGREKGPRDVKTFLASVTGLTYDVVYECEASSSRDKFIEETRGHILLDSGAPQNVCGIQWYQDMRERMAPEMLVKVEETESSSVFRFGDSPKYTSLMKVSLPKFVVANQEVMIPIDVVDCVVPGLLSQKTLKKWKAGVDFGKSTMNVFGQRVQLEETDMGHLSLKIADDVRDWKDVYLVTSDGNVESGISDVEAADIALKMHRQFGHPKEKRLVSMIKSADVFKNDRDEEKIVTAVKKLTETCVICLKTQRPANRPVVGLPLATEFNECVSMDLKSFMYRGKQIMLLNMIDQATRFCTGVVITSKNKEYIIEKIFEIWIRPFGRPRKFLSDNGGEFINSSMIELAHKFGIDLKTTAAESPWSNGLCERHNGVVVEIVEKLLDDTNCSVNCAVAWAVNAKNTLTNVHGFSPYQLVFGRNPTVPGVQHDKLPALSEHNASDVVREQLEVLHAAREAFTKSENSEKIRRALRHNVRSCNDRRFVTGDKVYFKRDKYRVWYGPGTVLGQDGQQVLIKLSGYYYRASPSKVVLVEEGDCPGPFCDPTTRDDSEVETATMGASVPEDRRQIEEEILQVDEPKMINQSRPRPDSQDQPPLRLSNSTEVEELSAQHVVEGSPASLVAGSLVVPVLDRRKRDTLVKEAKLQEKIKRLEEIKKRVNHGSDHVVADVVEENTTTSTSEVSEEEDDTDDSSYSPSKDNALYFLEACNYTGLVEEANKLSGDDEVMLAKQVELKKWTDNNVYAQVKDQGQYRISTTWVVNVKQADGQRVTKARLVARGYEEQLSMRKDSPTCMTSSTRVATSIISAKDWELNSMDVYAAFLQGQDIKRDVYIKPPKEANQGGYLWKLKKVVYGLSDAPRNWYVTLRSFLERNDVRVSKYDPALFSKYSEEGDLIGIMVCHVDDFLWGGDDGFKDLIIKPLMAKFKISGVCITAFKFLGLNVHQYDEGITVNQNLFIGKVQKMELSKKSKLLNVDKINDKAVSEMRSVLGQLNWASGKTRPDISFEACQASTRVNEATVKDVTSLINKAVKKLKSDDWSLMFKRLKHLDTLYLCIFTDASFNNLPRGGSQEGFIIVLADINLNCCPLDWGSKRIKRVVKSTLAAETLAAQDGVDRAYLLSTILKELIGRTTSIQTILFTDSKSLYDTVGTSNMIKDQKLLVDMCALRESNERKEVEFCWIPTEEQIADSLTKAGASNKLMIDVVSKGTLKGLTSVVDLFKKKRGDC